jgi:hypothetical protein
VLIKCACLLVALSGEHGESVFNNRMDEALLAWFAQALHLPFDAHQLRPPSLLC